MKKEKTCAILYYVSAVLFYAAAAINLLGGNNTSTGVVWLCLGSTMDCLFRILIRMHRFMIQIGFW